MTPQTRTRYAWIVYNALLGVSLTVAFVTLVWSRVRAPHSFAGYIPSGVLLAIVGAHGLRFRRELIACVRERPRYWFATGILPGLRTNLTAFTRMHASLLIIGIVLVVAAVVRWWIAA